MIKTIGIEDFINNSEDIPIVDVRTPSEYNKGHITGAINIPLFSDKERAEVGTCYKQIGKDEAVELGLGFVGPRLVSFVKECKKIASNGEIKVYCFRGGMRSESFAWLLDIAGFKKIYRLDKGYKSFRNYVLNFFEKDYTLNVLSGMTGSGKTDILIAMENIGFQVIDLEGFANHRGSAFGGIGKTPETSTEKYENSIFGKMKTFNLEEPIWIEDESRNVGKVLVPPAIFNKMENSKRLIVEVPLGVRAEHLARDYTGYGDETIIKSLDIIKKRLSERYKPTVEHINNKEYKEAAILILPYYDSSYTKGLVRREASRCYTLKLDKDAPMDTALKIKELIENGEC